METFGHEMLYRGQRTRSWVNLDKALLRSLADMSLKGRLFVNLSPQSILEISDALIFEASATNQIYFEWTESWCSDE